MRILQVGPVPPEAGGVSAGGIPSHLWGLARALRDRGHEVAVLADNVPYVEPWPRLRDGVAVFGTAGFRGPRRSRALAGPTALAVPRLKAHFGTAWSWRWVASKAAAFSEARSAFAPEVAHVHAPEARFPFAAMLARVPVVSTVHSTHYIEFAEPAREEAHRALVRRNVALARDLVFVSRFVEGRYERLFGDSMRRVRRHVLPNPLDASAFRPVPRREARARLCVDADEPVLLFVGALIPRKDPASLLEAAALLHERGTSPRVLLVGEGPEEAALRDLARSRGIDGRVRFEGVKPSAALSDYYSAADLFVLPSLMESFGLVFVEAMLCGCPVVGTPDVLGEVLPGDAYGIQAPSGDPAALAGAISAAMDRRWDREALRRWGEGFDWGSRIAGFERLYEGLLERGGGVRR
ncbi:MAG: glycosyltransferase family 4 protein [Coriobacteriia bacterium]|nr:glycosyltransferase family 4 protein [Coriobacteriia bacterium]